MKQINEKARFDVCALGEILIDFTPAGISAQGNILFERNPGGAPANVLASLAKLGRKTAFIGKVGEDLFGSYLVDVLKAHKIDTRGVRYSSGARTTLAFVHLDESGDRSFSFYRNPGADTTLEPQELDLGLIRNSKIFHFGSLSLTDEPVRSAALKAIQYAKENGCILSYDPNLRPLLWRDLDSARMEILSVMPYADILKMSVEELEFLTGERDCEKGAGIIQKNYRNPFILITLGKEGSFCRLGSKTIYQKSFDVQTVDTTGAGDAYLGGFLYALLSQTEELTAGNIRPLMEFASAAAALSATKNGAIPAMPLKEEVEALIRNNRKH